MTLRPWSSERREPTGDYVFPCDRCGNLYRAADLTWTSCPKCAAFDRIAVPVMPPAAVLKAAKKACDTKPHHKPARRRKAA